MTAATPHPIAPPDEFARDRSGIDARDFRTALGHFATGVTIITAMAEDARPIGLTCNSFASISLNPPLVLWSLGIYSPNMSVFQNASHFAVNVLDRSQAWLATQFARSADDKFTGVTWRSGLGDAPVLAGTVACFECRSVDRYYGGDHVIFLGSVEAYVYNIGEPLLFAKGAFGGFSPAL